MERKTWTVDVDGRRHAVVLNWTYWGGHRQVVVDGRVMGESSRRMRGHSEQAFEIDGHPAMVRTMPSWRMSAKFVITLEVDGGAVRPEAGKKSRWEA